jgi:hypothetical protein
LSFGNPSIESLSVICNKKEKWNDQDQHQNLRTINWIIKITLISLKFKSPVWLKK